MNKKITLNTLVLEEILPNVVLANTESQYELASTFMRLQEFYESPYKDIRGKYFTVEQFQDKYATKNEEFTYWTDWGGFNVPSNVVFNFLGLFSGDLTVKEKKLIKGLEETGFLSSGERFYLIGVYGSGKKTKEYLHHEICHAFYYLDERFRNTSNKLIDDLTSKHRNNIIKTLKEWGYHDEVIKDEINAYLATSSKSYINNDIGLNIDVDVINPFRENFKLKLKYEELK